MIGFKNIAIIVAVALKTYSLAINSELTKV